VKVDVGFPRRILAVLCVTGALLAYPLLLGSREIATAAVVGALLSTANVLLGYLAIEYSFEKSYTTFMKMVLGGMVARMLLTLGIMVVLIVVLHMHAVALTVSLLGFYLIYLVMEVLYVQKKILVRNREHEEHNG